MAQRAFISGITVALLAAPLAAEAQQPPRLPRVGWLSSSGSSSVFREVNFTCDEDERGRFYVYEGIVDRMPPIRGTALARALVTPGGYSQGWNASLLFRIAGVALAA